jgi:hypothetical protein
MVLDPSTRARLPAVAAGLFAVTGVLALALGGALALAPVPGMLGVDVPVAYRYLLAAFAVLGGGLHLLAARWTRQRRGLFRIVMTALVGMVLLQISAPLDIAALACLWLSRDAFGGERER